MLLSRLVGVRDKQTKKYTPHCFWAFIGDNLSDLQEWDHTSYTGFQLDDYVPPDTNRLFVLIFVPHGPILLS